MHYQKFSPTPTNEEIQKKKKGRNLSLFIIRKYAFRSNISALGALKKYTTLSDPNKRAPGWSLVVQSKSVTLVVSSKVGWKLSTYNGGRSWGTSPT